MERRSKRKRQEEGVTEENFELKFIDTYIGNGVFVKEYIPKGLQLLEYMGKLRSCSPSDGEEDETYKYYFHNNGKKMYIDATNTKGLGRMVNDSAKPNCKVKKIMTDKPRLWLYSIKDIHPGEQLTFDYGVKDAPWRKRKKDEVKPVLYEKPSTYSDSAPKVDVGHDDSDDDGDDDYDQDDREDDFGVRKKKLKMASTSTSKPTVIPKLAAAKTEGMATNTITTKPTDGDSAPKVDEGHDDSDDDGDDDYDQDDREDDFGVRKKKLKMASTSTSKPTVKPKLAAAKTEGMATNTITTKPTDGDSAPKVDEGHDDSDDDGDDDYDQDDREDDFGVRKKKLKMASTSTSKPTVKPKLAAAKTEGMATNTITTKPTDGDSAPKVDEGHDDSDDDGDDDYDQDDREDDFGVRKKKLKMASTSTSKPTVKPKLAAAKTEGMATNTITTKPTDSDSAPKVDVGHDDSDDDGDDDYDQDDRDDDFGVRKKKLKMASTSTSKPTVKPKLAAAKTEGMATNTITTKPTDSDSAPKVDEGHDDSDDDGDDDYDQDDREDDFGVRKKKLKMASTSTSKPTVKPKLAAAKTEGMATNTITTKPTDSDSAPKVDVGHDDSDDDGDDDYDQDDREDDFGVRKKKLKMASTSTSKPTVKPKLAAAKTEGMATNTITTKPTDSDSAPKVDEGHDDSDDGDDDYDQDDREDDFGVRRKKLKMASTSTSKPTVKPKLAAAKTEGMATNTITTKPTEDTESLVASSTDQEQSDSELDNGDFKQSMAIQEANDGRWSDEDISLEDSGDEYIPPVSSDFTYSEEDIVDTDAQYKEQLDESYNAEEHVSDSTSDSDVIPIEQELVNKLTKPNLTIMQSKKKEDGTRIWDKKHCCQYCMKLVAKLPRHFEQKHKHEFEVEQVLSLPKKSPARKEKLRELMNAGDFLHNKNVIAKQTGNLIPFKRPKEEDSSRASDYVTCSQCLGLFLGRDLWRHAKRCPKQNRTARKQKRINHQAAGLALMHSNDFSKNESFKTDIVNKFSSDEVSFVARHDELIVRFGEKLYSKHSQQPHQHQYVRQKMREVARLLMNARKSDGNIHNLMECVDPVKFPSIVEAVKVTCGFDGNGKYKVPSLALKIGHSLRKCANILKNQSLVTRNSNLKEKANSFLELCDGEWAAEVSSAALQNLHAETFNKPNKIPMAEDLKKLHDYLKAQADTLQKSLTEFADKEHWRELANVTLAQIVLFNRRRGGEAERLEVSQYLKGTQQSVKMQAEVASCLSPFERQLAENMKRIEIRGKRGRRVPVLLTDKLHQQMELLMKTREVVGISTRNIYVFARFGDAQFPLRSSDVLRKFALECDANNPELITSTSLRKHVATISQILNLKDNELDQLANFLGHDVRIHREFYRLPEDTIQLAKISKLLVELESGKIQNHEGKTLDEIHPDVEDLQVEIPSAETSADGETDGVPSRKDLQVEIPSAETSADGETDGVPSRKVTCKKKSTKRTMWSEEEKKAVHQFLGKFFVSAKLPGKALCLEAKSKAAVLSHRPWQQIKFYIKNHKVV